VDAVVTTIAMETTRYYTIHDGRALTLDALATIGSGAPSDDPPPRTITTMSAGSPYHFYDVPKTMPPRQANMRRRIDFVDKDVRMHWVRLMKGTVLPKITAGDLEEVRHHTAFTVDPILSAAECAGTMRWAEDKMESAATQYAQRDRRCDRALVRAPELAAELFQRLIPHLREEDYEGRIPLCFGHGGVWRPRSFNEVIKVMRYPDGGEFVEHRDGPWIPREDQASLFTVLIYLNQGFEGGRTVLFGDTAVGVRTLHSNVRVPAVVPATGMALVFNHDLVHAGEPVKASATTRYKWILRAELVFERVVPSPDLILHGKYRHLVDAAFIECKALYEKTFEHCANGDKASFMADYQNVVIAQREAARLAAARQLGDMRSSPACQLLPHHRCDTDGEAPKPTRTHVTADVFGEVLLFLDDAHLVLLMTCSRRFYYEVAVSPMWRPRCIDAFGDSLPRSLHATGASGVNCHLPWLSVYLQQRTSASRQFQPAVLWLLSDGCVLGTPSGRRPKQRWYAGALRLYGVVDGRLVPLRKYDFATHFDVGEEMAVHLLPEVWGHLRWAYPDHCNFPNSERYTLGYLRRQGVRCNVDKHRPVCDGAGNVDLAVLVPAIDSQFDTVMVPLLVIDHPLWSVSVHAPSPHQNDGDPTATCVNVSARRRAHVRGIFEVLRTPALRMLTTAQCVGARLAFLWHKHADEVDANVLCVLSDAVLRLRLQHGRPVVSAGALEEGMTGSRIMSTDEWTSSGDPWTSMPPGETWLWDGVLHVGSRFVVVTASDNDPDRCEVMRAVKNWLDARKQEFVELDRTDVVQGAAVFGNAPDFNARLTFRVAPDG
jgi:hypothetical protein